eukprot:15299273-Alexandrium_andersonii.AAC.1
MKQNLGIDRAVGQSLGGSVALEHAKSYDAKTRTYMAPVVDTGFFNFGIQPERCRNNNDSISMFDRGAKSYESKPDASSETLGTLTSVVGAALSGDEESNNMD